MSAELMKIPQTQAIVEADPWRDHIDLIKRTVAKGVSDDELQLFLYTAKRCGLDPLAKQIHAIKRWNGKEQRDVMSIQTGIDGYRLIADRTGKLAGITDPTFDKEDELHPGKATVTVYKLVAGERCPFTASARWSEYVQTYKNKESGRWEPSTMWQKMPFLMLGKCAESLALRKAFPADLSGVYTFEEMAQSDNEVPQAKPVEAEYVSTPAKAAATPLQQNNAQQEKPQNRSSKAISEPQQKRLFAIARKANASPDDIKAVIRAAGYEHTKDIAMNDYEAICTLFESGQWSDIATPGTGIQDKEINQEAEPF